MIRIKNRILTIITVAALSATTAYEVSAAEEQSSSGSKIGFVNIQLLLREVPQAMFATKRLEASFGGRKAEILEFQKSCQKMEKNLEKEAAALSKQQQQKKIRKIRACSSELKLMDEEYGADLRIAQAEELQKLQRLVYKTVDQIAKQEKFDLIVNEAVIFASPAADISRKVLGRMQQISKTPNIPVKDKK
ncbi:MAG: OmpH family outer membrane protein [Thiotrichales bacterium]|jgi:outer membrane protein|nr:OmpH family outer membrane protein [Thiotrichales bacterium]MBT3614308.1 OmpH family outer membrane protein [Thiotrichales bacterium]MBT3752829.1 OmpH family outer membrane protein [Thiotrichales bacterium]MBT3837699.1 OmpH family outer membrane protein [Thiotrichales bacterium]MBT4152199.1 OmpH family outer membrane protein [Thiotrichales bacterium]